MTEPAALQNQLLVGTSVSPPTNGIDPIDSWLEGHTIIRGDDLLSIPPALDEDTDDPHGDQLHGLNVAHIPLPRLAEVDLAAVNGGEAATNDRLQQVEQEDLQAIRNILPTRPIRNSVITASHYWSVLKQLRDNLPAEGSHGMSHAREYARILQRLAEVMTLLRKEDYETAPCVHPLCYECVLKVLEEKTPDLCPVAYDECLNRLCEDITATSSLIRAADGVYVIKDREQYARRLRSLAALVLSCV